MNLETIDNPEIMFQNIKTNIEYYFFYLVDLFYGRNHIDKVIDHLYIGNIYTALNEDILKEHNIQAVVNCTTDIPFFLDLFDHILDIIKTHIDNNENVFVHCRAGVQRSASIVVAYLMKYNKINLEKATTYLKTIRHCIFNPQTNFIKPLTTFENRIIEK